MQGQTIEERADHRGRVVRTAILYTPGGIIATGLFLVALSNLLAGNLGAIIATVLLGIVAFAVDFEALAALRDLRATPTETAGRVLRLWSKGRFLFFGRVHYLLIDRRVFEISPEAALELQDGDDVRIEHWPHTNTIISIRRLPAETAERGPEGGSGIGSPRL